MSALTVAMGNNHNEPGSATITQLELRFSVVDHEFVESQPRVTRAKGSFPLSP